MNQLLEEPKIPNSDNFSGMQVRTISGLDAQQIADAKCSIMQDFIQVQANITQPQKDKEGMHGAKYATLNNVLSSIKEASKGIDLAFIQQPLMQEDIRSALFLELPPRKIQTPKSTIIAPGFILPLRLEQLKLFITANELRYLMYMLKLWREMN